MEPEDHSALVAWQQAQGRWYALADGERAPLFNQWARLKVIDLGLLHLPSGAIGACDPYVFLEGVAASAHVAPGDYPVRLTLAELPEESLEAYLSLVLDPDADEVRREEVGSVGVDAGTVGFVDAEAAKQAFAADVDWEAVVQGPGGWFAAMDDPAHLRGGCANVPLPGGVDGNVVLCHSGFGDGIYPLVLGFDAQDRVVRVHIDLLVIGTPRVHPAARERRPGPTEAQRALAAAAMALPNIGIVLFVAWMDGSATVAVGAALVWTLFGWAVAYRMGWTDV